MSVDTDQAKPLQEHSPRSPAHFVYLVRCSNGALYCGYTTDVDKRVAAHNAGKGAKYTRAHLPVILMAFWPFPCKGDALRTERVIKQLSRARKVQLLEQTIKPRELCQTGYHLRLATCLTKDLTLTGCLPHE